MIKVLFLIHDLGQGGAEKVLVNLVNNMNRTKFNITVMALFGGGVNERFLSKNIRLINCHQKAFPGNSHIMKLFSPEQLYRHYIREEYDIVVSYLEGPSARIVSGCPYKNTKLVSWVHSTTLNKKMLSHSFRSLTEARSCYNKIDMNVFVSKGVKDAFLNVCPLECDNMVLYNTIESDQIRKLASVPVEDTYHKNGVIHLCGMGKITPNKGFLRLLRIQARLLKDHYPIHLNILGEGPDRSELELWCKQKGIDGSVSFLGYQSNPYKYISKCDLFVCASYAEGFSTAATEALIVGTPVCTVDVSGMKEMLGENNEWGIVTENSEEALYQGIKSLLDNPSLLAYYKMRATERGKVFSTENTVRAVEKMFESL